jgi:hypothetical protein
MKSLIVKMFEVLVTWAEILHQYRSQTNRSGFH